MLEVVNLTKIYKTKGGLEVKALDNVSVSFPKTGMVFLLGKSGSGKSTLLNVCGGLDSPTSGEVIVKGKSSKDFNQSDFDSYRNTYVGFIFQEYNILNEFSVEDNIALALELQGKSKNKEEVERILKEVDLEGYAKRKPNTLSGGQKQRIAIARALIKSPEIIMADEPSGALDSATGKQVFETLKRLSKDKLVIVVSHDRDFAEQYGDRIIELKDGRIISDISKVSLEKEYLSQNVIITGETLQIKGGTTLNSEDLLKIQDFINNNENDVIITKGQKEVKTFKEITNINDEDEQETFKETKLENIKKDTYDKDSANFIKSKLPIKHAYRIGVSNLSIKPFRLIMTVLICTIAFVLFGLASTLTFYDNEAVFKETLEKSNCDNIKIGNESKLKYYDYNEGELIGKGEYYIEAYFSEEDIKEYSEKYGNNIFGVCNVNLSIKTYINFSNYYSSLINSMGYLNENNELRNNIIYGNYPVNDRELCISKYMAESLINNVILDEENKKININSIEELIGQKIVGNNGMNFIISGIIDFGDIDPKYDVLKDKNSDYKLINEFSKELEDGIQCIAFTTMETIKEYSQLMTNNNTFHTSNYLGMYSSQSDTIFGEMLHYEKIEDDYSDVVFKDSNKKELNANEIIVTPDVLGFLVLNDKKYSHEITLIANILIQYDMTKEQLEESSKELLNDINQQDLMVIGRCYDENNNGYVGKDFELEIVGVKLNDTSSHLNRSKIYTNSGKYYEIRNEHIEHAEYYVEAEKYYEKSSNDYYDTIVISYDHSSKQTNALWEIHQNKDYLQDYTRPFITSYVAQELASIDEIVDSLSNVLLYIGLALAIFAIMLLSNFISVSIANKKREIGILRAVGARGIDVFKIFFSESLTITTICTIISILFTVILCNFLNNQMVEAFFEVRIFVFGIISYIVLIFIAIGTAFLATILPVYLAARKKPVESIRAL